MGNYEFQFSDDSPYGAALRLLDDSDPSGRVVLDIGCGAAALAAPVADRGGLYVGLDVDKDAVAKLAENGLEGHVVDLTQPDLHSTLREIVGDRRIAAILCLDVLEHVAEPERVLTVLSELTDDQPGVELVVSIPNVGHLDLARRLLVGRWDTTDSGLLDRTHLRFFTDRSLTELMTAAGWYEGERLDFHLEQSDQHWPDHPAFEPGTTLSALLERTRSGADEHGHVNQFVRRYHRGARRSPERDAATGPFLSVVMRTQGRRHETMTDVLCCLAAQTDLDFEVVLVVHGSSATAEVREVVDQFEGNITQRVRIVPCDGGTRSRPANAGLRAARGRYVAFLDDDDLVTANWVENIRAGATAHPGQVVRWWAAEQKRTWGGVGPLVDHAASGPLTPAYATTFDLVRHLRQNETPFHCFAFPRTLVDLGFQFDEALTVCEDWEFLVRAASICGVHDTEQMTSIYNKWSQQTSSHAVSADEWFAMRAVVHVALDEEPLLLPPGSVRSLERTLEQQELSQRRIDALEAELAAVRATLRDFQEVSNNAHHALSELRSSTSWKVSAPLRAAGKVGRKMAARRAKD